VPSLGRVHVSSATVRAPLPAPDRDQKRPGGGAQESWIESRDAPSPRRKPLSRLALTCLDKKASKEVCRSASTRHRLPDNNMPSSMSVLKISSLMKTTYPRTDSCPFQETALRKRNATNTLTLSPQMLHKVHMLAGWFPQGGPSSHAGSSTRHPFCIGVDLQKRTLRESCTLARVAACSRMEMVWGGDEGKGQGQARNG
jgi:hypothetical protein